LSSKVEQLLKRWEQEGTLKIELSSKYISVFGDGTVSAFQPHQLLLDSDGCGFKISLQDATFDFRDTASLAEPPRLSQDEQFVNHLQIAVPENQRILLGEVRQLG
jgi:hypothetical protein